MKGSIGRRLFRTILIIGVTNVVITMIVSEIIYEDLEEANLSIQLAQERAHFEKKIHGSTIQEWRSALLTAIYVPDGQITELPHMLRDLQAPFAAEVDLGETTYLISIERTPEPPGILYLAQDISVLEDREDTFQEIGFTILVLTMLVLSYLMARIGTRQIVNPLQNLTRQISRIEPGTVNNRLQTEYTDHELVEIALTLNDLLDALDTYLRREKALVSLASHELRTPIAAILGALDVLDQRNSVNDADRKTLIRIRGAAHKMHADVDALLKLARRSEDSDQKEMLNMEECVRDVVNELEVDKSDKHSQRVALRVSSSPIFVEADPALVRMLMRNLIQNAIRHTRHGVFVTISSEEIEIVDEGPGIPNQFRMRLEQSLNISVPDEGLGLYIIRLICERLSWQLRVYNNDKGGTTLRLCFV